MYRSKIEFVQFSKKLIKEINSCYDMHKFVMSAFPDMMKTKILFNVNKKGIIVQSEIKPDWEKARNYRDYFVSSTIEEMELNFENDQVLQFSLLANPTKREQSGKRRFIRTENELSEWFVRKSNLGGFALLELSISPTKKNISKKKGNEITIGSVVFNGKLKVKSVEEFSKTIVEGIGTAKSFGFGLLMVKS